MISESDRKAAEKYIDDNYSKPEYCDQKEKHNEVAAAVIYGITYERNRVKSGTAREFWITDKGDYLSAGVEMWRGFIAKFKTESGLHVIELSALQASQAEVTELKERLNLALDSSNRVVDQRNALESKLKLAVEALKKADEVMRCSRQTAFEKQAPDFLRQGTIDILATLTEIDKG